MKNYQIQVMKGAPMPVVGEAYILISTWTHNKEVYIERIELFPDIGEFYVGKQYQYCEGDDVVKCQEQFVEQWGFVEAIGDIMHRVYTEIRNSNLPIPQVNNSFHESSLFRALYDYKKRAPKAFEAFQNRSECDHICEEYLRVRDLPKGYKRITSYPNDKG